ncbi:MAG: type II toxin-antitoxin system antitoxin SocA domain-containing protein [Cyanobacteria bacterium J06600_6]
MVVNLLKAVDMYKTLPINTSKITEAIALLLKLHQKPMILSQLLKMMYFVDRLSLAQTNYSLSNDSYLGKQSGLMPKYIPDLVLELQTQGILSKSSGGQGYIALQRDVAIATLSSLEIENITRVYQQKKSVNPFNLLDWNYDLEFIKNHVKTKRTILITPLDVMSSLGKTKAEMQIYLTSQSTQNQSKSLSAA